MPDHDENDPDALGDDAADNAEDTSGVEDPENDLEQILARLEHGAVVGRMIAALRPSRQLMGEKLVAVVGLYERKLGLERLRVQIAESQSLIDAYTGGPNDELDLEERYAWEPWLVRSGSTAVAEIGALTAAGWPGDFLQRPPPEYDVGRPLYLVRRLIEAAIDHLRAIGILMQSDEVLRAPLALARVTAEAAGRACYLLDNRADARARLIRTLNAELEMLEEARKAANREGDKEALAEVIADTEVITQTALSHGAKKCKDHRRFLDPYVRVGTMIDDVLEREHHSTYHALSAFVHSQEDEGTRLAMGLAREDRNPHEGLYLALHCFAALFAFVEACGRTAEYTGWDLSDLDEIRDALLDLWGRGAGLADDDYRKIAEQRLAAEAADAAGLDDEDDEDDEPN